MNYKTKRPQDLGLSRKTQSKQNDVCKKKGGRKVTTRLRKRDVMMKEKTKREAESC